MSARFRGKVKWFNNRKGYGFIARPEGPDVFVHYRAIRGDGFKSLTDGQDVEYSLIETDKGLQADDVVATEEE